MLDFVTGTDALVVTAVVPEATLKLMVVVEGDEVLTEDSVMLATLVRLETPEVVY